MKDLLKLANDDYQKRGEGYPKANKPDSITVEVSFEKTTIEFDFKNTTESDALTWYKKSKELKEIVKYEKDYDIDISTYQDGDYQDDWVKLIFLISKKDIIENEKTEYTYCYILSTKNQIKSIDLLNYKEDLQKIIESYFGEKLIEVEFSASSYTLILNQVYTVAEKRRLGQLISMNSDLSKHVNKISYNNSKDISGQLFRINKSKKQA